MKRIFITGCARSGSTLLNRLFYAFSDITVIDYEISIDDFCNYKCNTGLLVGKRTPLTILSVPLSEDEIKRQLELVHNNNMIIINIIRDGRDVVHQNPTGPIVNVNRWIGCMLQAWEFKKEISIQVRYEDLVTNPDSILTQIENVLFVKSKYKFSEYPDFVPDDVFDEPEYKNYYSYNKRKIDSRSVGHSNDEYNKKCKSEEQRDFFKRILIRYGYLNSKSPKDCQWDIETLKQEKIRHKQDSIKHRYVAIKKSRLTVNIYGK